MQYIWLTENLLPSWVSFGAHSLYFSFLIWISNWFDFEFNSQGNDSSCLFANHKDFPTDETLWFFPRILWHFTMSYFFQWSNRALYHGRPRQDIRPKFFWGHNKGLNCGLVGVSIGPDPKSLKSELEVFQT